MGKQAFPRGDVTRAAHLHGTCTYVRGSVITINGRKLRWPFFVTGRMPETGTNIDHSNIARWIDNRKLKRELGFRDLTLFYVVSGCEPALDCYSSRYGAVRSRSVVAGLVWILPAAGGLRPRTFLTLPRGRRTLRMDAGGIWRLPRIHRPPGTTG